MTKARNLADNALTTVSPTELGYVDGVTSSIQTQLDAKLATATASTTYLANSLVDAKGDVLTATADNTPARLAVGTDGQVLTAASGQSTGLQWATPSSGSMTLLSTTTLSNQTTLTYSSISQDYKDLVLTWRNVTLTDNNATNLWVRFNGISTTSFYYWWSVNYGSAASAGAANYIPVSNSIGTMNATALHHGYIRFPFYYLSTNASRTYQGQTTWSRVTEGSGSSGSFINGTCGVSSTFTTNITSLTLQTSNGNNMLAGTVELYGVK